MEPAKKDMPPTRNWYVRSLPLISVSFCITLPGKDRDTRMATPADLVGLDENICIGNSLDFIRWQSLERRWFSCKRQMSALECSK